MGKVSLLHIFIIYLYTGGKICSDPFTLVLFTVLTLVTGVKVPIFPSPIAFTCTVHQNFPCTVVR